MGSRPPEKDADNLLLESEIERQFDGIRVLLSENRLREAAEIWVKNTCDKWKKITNYGMRWEVEVVFFDLKGPAGEAISAMARSGMIREALMKALAYNHRKRVRANVIGITGNYIYVADVQLCISITRE